MDPQNLDNSEGMTSMTIFASPCEEYGAAFEERDLPFLYFYSFEEGAIRKRALTRGEFWDLACSAGAHLESIGISKGDRVVHCFSANSLYDLIFRLASVLIGCTPVTINWQADDDARIVYKATITEAKGCIYDNLR